MIDTSSLYLAKARESLEGAESELANHRYNNCASRCYYSCFQAVIQALIQAGIRPTAQSAEWGHAFVQAQFAGVLITRRKLYPANLRDILGRNLLLRRKADYEDDRGNAHRSSGPSDQPLSRSYSEPGLSARSHGGAPGECQLWVEAADRSVAG